ncbi:hypothetical protein ACIQU6_24000 [Streptomyces sp. NPDC090442]|uniref:hypothetical protein n=1 Tax=Streptomyces sp. NPDC090442 TaxID=3365962 RepID=UPI003825C17B
MTSARPASPPVPSPVVLAHYAELWWERAGTPDGKLRDFAREGGDPDEDRIAQYLRDGEELFWARGTVGKMKLGGFAEYATVDEDLVARVWKGGVPSANDFRGTPGFSGRRGGKAMRRGQDLVAVPRAGR